MTGKTCGRVVTHCSLTIQSRQCSLRIEPVPEEASPSGQVPHPLYYQLQAWDLPASLFLEPYSLYKWARVALVSACGVQSWDKDCSCLWCQLISC